MIKNIYQQLDSTIGEALETDKVYDEVIESPIAQVRKALTKRGTKELYRFGFKKRKKG